MRNRFLIVLGLFAAACGDEGGNTSGIPDPCNPLGGEGCLLPWPSAVYTTTDATSRTGLRVDLPIEAMPTNEDRVAIDPAWVNRWDGFSPTGPLLVAFPTGVSPVGLPSHQDPDASLAPGSPVVLVNIDTGERVPLFAEVDQNTEDVTKRDLIIRPLARLDGGARYVAVVRKAVKAADGGELPSPPGFVALRDGTGFGHPRFAELAARWPGYFARLAELGIDRSDIVVAWDFVTASDELLRGDLTTMRDAALSAMGTNGASLGFAITSTPANTAATYKRYLGTFTSPDFLTAGEADESLLRRGADGVPTMQGMRDARFGAVIPSCVTTAPLPRPTIVFGHGLFGSAQDYLNNDFLIDVAQVNCVIIIAGDFIGLTERQLQLAPLAVNDMNGGLRIAEKLAQSVIDFMALGALARGPMAQAPEFQVGGVSVIDPTQVFYLGGSLGGIMGNTIMAYDPSFKKGVLAVPGGVWSMLLERSTAWLPLMGAAQGSYRDPSVYQLVVALFGMMMEPYDPITTAAHVTRDPLFDGQPAKDILIWYAAGDAVVTNLATEMVVRELGVPVLAPSVKAPWGLEPIAGPLPSGVVIYDEHPTPLPPDTNQVPRMDNGTHSDVNQNGSALRFIAQFLFNGQVVPECKVDGVPVACDCGVTGACD